MALYAQYAQRIANTTPHAKSGINRLDIAFIEKTKAENAIITKTMNNIEPNIFFEIQKKKKKSSTTSRVPIATM